MEKQKMHIIKRYDHIILYDIEKMELYLGDNVPIEKLESLTCQNVVANNPSNNLIETISNENLIDEKKRMHRVTVCVSNDCNLRCKYCYAKGGSYGKERTLMNERTARKFVDFCISSFKRIDNILFFGGEPLLNYPIIEYICKLFKEQSANGSLPIPSFSMITNGTLCNDKIIDLIRENISFMTVSIDGNKYVNDKNRIYRNGMGSYDKIAYFINKCKKETPTQIQFEATYTSSHFNIGMNRFDVYSFLNSEFGINGIVVDEDTLDEKIMYDYLCSLTREDLLNSDFECLPLDFWQVALTITQKKPHKFCGIYDDRITITTDGNIVGCQMLLGSDNNIISNIFDTEALNKISHHQLKFKDNSSCKKCWCNSLCGGCVFQKFYSKSTKSLNPTPIDKSCSFTRLYIEEILYIILKIRTDKKLWSLFIEKFKEKFSF